MITVSHISKEFQIASKSKGLWGSFRHLFVPKYVTKKAVQDISFEVRPGEMIGFIGPNGAGKSTTIKMLSGILVPTSGEIRVNGRIPHKQREEHVAHIGVVFGQRTQLWWDLPLLESLELLKHVYKIPEQVYRKNFDLLSDLLDVGSFIQTPVRQLSLGQRMRGDLFAALLHDPAILFLDEPTIGLDVVAKEKIRLLLSTINKEKQVSVMLTTHDMVDIEKTCDRMIIIDKGRIMYDGSIREIRSNYGKTRTLVVDFKEEPVLDETAGVEMTKREGLRVWFQFNKDDLSASDLISRISSRNELVDLSIVEPEIDAIIKEIYEQVSDMEGLPSVKAAQ